MKRVTSCWTNENRGSARRWAMLAVDPVSRLSMQMTSWPWPSRNSERCEPMKPAPPVTRMRTGSARDHGAAPDGVVLEPEPAHPLRLVEVAPVDEERPPQHRPDPLHVEEAE